MRAAGYLLLVVWKQLRNSPARALLAVLAVAAAVALWVAVYGFTQSYWDSLAESIRTLGYEVLVTVKGCPYETASLVLQGGNVPMYVDEAIFHQVQADARVANATRFLMRAVPDSNYSRIRVFMGVDENFFKMKPWLKLEQGDWFSSPEAEEVVVGYGAAERLRLSLGDTVTALPGARPVRVVGILDRCGGQDDGTLFLPLARAQRLFDRPRQLSGIGVKLRQLDDLEAFAERVDRLPAVQVISLPQVQVTIFRLIRTGAAFAFSASLVAILVSLLGVTNAVLMSVLQRSRQTAVMRALGASQPDIFGLVMAEAVALCLFGGLAGIPLAAVMGRVISGLLASVLPFGDSGGVGISPSVALVAIAGALATGLAAGIYPGWRAGRIPPAVAMRE
jgi:putative ABC transport system permease protein